MHLHILGICGTFMGGVAALAREAGHTVTGSDANVYPPMSEQLEALGIELTEGFDPAQLDNGHEQLVVGNVVARGNPAMEAALDAGADYRSGPAWLAEQLLADRWVLAVAGTHGKTTTSSMLAWIMEDAGLAPGFLIGGVPGNFGISARLGESKYFVVEADEYDTAFFDKRSKFVHYRPRTLILNNLEFDHADIFPDLAAIQRQVHHLVRTVPGQGRIVCNGNDPALAATLEQGCWTPVEYFDGTGSWQAELLSADGSAFRLLRNGVVLGETEWPLLGRHNVSNALAAIVAAEHVGVAPATALAALPAFRNVKRRMEVVAQGGGITVYDDFAHHPTAIATTLAGLRAKVGSGRILALLEPRSNSMRMGVHSAGLAASLAAADHCHVLQLLGLEWNLADTLAPLGERLSLHHQLDDLLTALRAQWRAGDHVLVMSNGSFGGVHQRLQTLLESN